MTAAVLFAALDAPRRPSMILWLLAGIPVFAMYYIRRRCRHLPVLFLLHALLPVIYYMVPAGNGVNRTIRLLVCMGFVIYSLYLRFGTEDFASEPLPLPLAAGITLVCLFLQHYQGSPEWDIYYRLSTIVIFLLYVLILFLQAYEDFLAVNRLSTGKIPFREIFQCGMRSTFVYVLAAGVILLFVSQYAWLRPLLQLLKNGAASILRFLFSLIPNDAAEPVMEAQQIAGGAMEIPEAGEPFILWVILEYLAVFALLCACIFLLYRGIRKLFAFLRDRIRFNVKDPEAGKQDGYDIREKLERDSEDGHSAGSNHRFFSVFGDPGQKIRKLYRKKLSTSTLAKKGPAFYTARDAEKVLHAEGMAEIYEKARYSEEICTDSDVQQMRTIIRK